METRLTFYFSVLHCVFFCKHSVFNFYLHVQSFEQSCFKTYHKFLRECKCFKMAASCFIPILTHIWMFHFWKPQNNTGILYVDVYAPSNSNSLQFLILEYRETILLRKIWIHSISLSIFVNFRRIHSFLQFYCSLAGKHSHNWKNNNFLIYFYGIKKCSFYST